MGPITVPLHFRLRTLVLVVASYRLQLWDHISNHCYNPFFHSSNAFSSSTLCQIFLLSFTISAPEFSILTSSFSISNNVFASYFLVLASVNLIALSSTSWSLPFPPVLPCPLLTFTRFSTSLRFAIAIVSLYVASHLLLCCRLCYQNLAGPKEGKVMGQRGKLSDNNGMMSQSHNN